MIGRLNHVGVATPDIEASAAMYRDLFGATAITPKREMPEQGVWVSFVTLPNTEIELIQPIDATSPIAGFLAKNPAGGQHHVCFEVDDILAARDAMLEKGAKVLGPGEPRIGAHGTPILFLHPKGTGGVLVADVERASPAQTAGIRQGMVVYKIGNYDVDSPAKIEALLHDVEGGTQVDFTLGAGSYAQRLNRGRQQVGTVTLTARE